MKTLRIAKELAAALSDVIPKYWDGKECILEMKNSGNRQWKQMEWIGFYFQFCCERALKSMMTIPGARYGNVEFDAFLGIPWDFKAHAINASRHEIIVNDSEAIAQGIAEFGAVGVVVAMGRVIYNDEDRTFQKWHQELKGSKSKYEIERERRGAWSRRRKTHFDLQQISFIEITDSTLMQSGTFQKNFRNADGSPRRAKVKINVGKLSDEIVHVVEF